MFQFPKRKEDWTEIAEEFKLKWNFINCGGAIDGKHIRIVPPPNTGAFYYNYKKFYSVILLALVNANYEFIWIDVGKQGRMSDMGAMEWTTFYKKLTENKLNFPSNEENDEKLNFVILGDEGFALQPNLLKPYAQKDITLNERAYNYRLSRARNVSENSFGILASRFRIFHTRLAMNPENINSVILAACVLHNFLLKTCKTYVSSTTFDRENNVTHTVQLGDWRQDVSNNLVSLQANRSKNAPTDAKKKK